MGKLVRSEIIPIFALLLSRLSMAEHNGANVIGGRLRINKKMMCGQEIVDEILHGNEDVIRGYFFDYCIERLEELYHYMLRDRYGKFHESIAADFYYYAVMPTKNGRRIMKARDIEKWTYKYIYFFMSEYRDLLKSKEGEVPQGDSDLASLISTPENIKNNSNSFDEEFALCKSLLDELQDNMEQTVEDEDEDKKKPKIDESWFNQKNPYDVKLDETEALLEMIHRTMLSFHARKNAKENPGERYFHVMKRLVIDEVPPSTVALEVGMDIMSFYPLKAKAMKDWKKAIVEIYKRGLLA